MHGTCDVVLCSMNADGGRTKLRAKYSEKSLSGRICSIMKLKISCLVGWLFWGGYKRGSLIQGFVGFFFAYFVSFCRKDLKFSFYFF